MKIERVLVGEVLALQRRQVEIELKREYRLIGVYSFGKGIFHRDPVPGSALGDYRFFAVAPGDLVLSNIQAWEGAIAHATDVDKMTVGTHRFLTYVPLGGRIDTSWARWFFLSEPGFALIQQASPGTVQRNRTLSIDRFEALEIPLPPLDVQRELAARLDRWRSNTEGLLAHLQRPITSPAATTARLPSLIDAVLRRASKAVTPIGDLADFVSDTVHPGDDPSPAKSFVGLQHVESHTGRMIGSSPLGSEKGRKFRFRVGDVVYGYLRPYLNKVWVADRDGLCSVDQYVLRPRKGVSAELLAHQLRSATVLGQAMELTHNLQLPRLRSGLLAAITVPAVPSENRTEVVAQLDRVRELIVAATKVRKRQIAAAAALTPSLLNQAFSGLM